jgi:hypothetical protein
VARLVRLICVCTGVALAVWLLPASIHIVDWSADGAVRVALLAPLWRLWAALVGAAAVAIAIAALGSRQVDGTSRVLDAMNPLALLWLWAVPYLPWIPDRAPALLLLAGPLRWGVLALAVSGSAATIWCARARARPVRLPGRGAIVVLSLATYLCFGLWSAMVVGPDADEPHYLVITQSLLRDHDLAIENNHARGDYHEYFGGTLGPDFLRRGLNEVIYSIHAPGLPALLVPAYAIAGYPGAVVTLCVFGALAALAVFDLAALLAGAGAAWITWAAVCLTVPFVPHSWLIFPEMPGALLVGWAALWLYAPLPAREGHWIWRGTALAMLPWLHTKFVILLAAMVAVLLIRVWRTPKAAAALVTPVTVSIALWLYSFHLLYGVFDPQIPYGDFPRFYVRVANIPRGVLGLLFDQKFGLLMYAPVYAVAIAGCWMMLRTPALRLFTIALLGTVVAFVASSARMYMWWGGASAPARFLVPILPLLAPMVAIAFRDLRSTAARTVSALLLLVSLAVAAAGVVSPQHAMLFSAAHGLANLATAAQGPSPLSYLLPIFTEEDIRGPLTLLAPWAIGALLALGALVLVSRMKVRVSGVAAASGALSIFVVGGAVLAGAPAPASQQRATALRGRLELMRADDGSSLRGLDYGRRVRMNERQTLELTAVSVTRSTGGLTDNPRRLAGPFQLPAGRFTARIVFGDGPTGTGAVFVTLGNGLQVARSDAALTRSTTLTFSLPVDMPVWVGVSDEALGRSVHQVDVVAESVVPAHARPGVRARAIEAIEGRPGAFIVYADDETYPEGGVYWTQGTRTGKVLVAPAGASALVLTLHVGPVGGAVRVTVDGQDHSLTLSADQTQRIEIPLRPESRLVPVTVGAPGRFRPSDHDPGSTDRRWLGCQVRVALR